jgi:hypothetical protein
MVFMSDERPTTEEREQGHKVFGELLEAICVKIIAITKRYEPTDCTIEAIPAALTIAAVRFTCASLDEDKAGHLDDKFVAAVAEEVREMIARIFFEWSEKYEAEQRAKSGPGNAWSGPPG